MIEDVTAVRRQALERHNGWLNTWLHYNRVTLAISAIAMGILFGFLHMERVMRMQAQAHVRLLSQSRMSDLSCFSVERSTSVIIAASSRAQATQALIDAANTAYLVRSTWQTANDNWSVPYVQEVK